MSYLTLLASKLGYLGIVMIVGLEYACFPIPSEIVLPFVGLGISQGAYHFIPALALSILGGLAGSLICYIIGYIGGVPFLNWMQRRFPKSRKSIIALESWFQKYGNLAVLFTRVVPLTRTYVSFLAGSQKLNVGSFLSYSCLGITFWNTLLVMLGYFLGDNIELIDRIMKNYTFAVGILFVIAVYFFVQKKRKPKVD